jgi:GT2 family glycosyltransferase
VAALAPRRVRVIGAPALAEALEARGVAVAEPAQDADLTIVPDPAEAPPGAPRLLAVPTPDCRAWLGRAAAAGYRPALAHDASYLAPTALLLEPGPADPALLDATAALLQARAALAERAQSLAAATADLARRLQRHAQSQRRAVRLNLGLQDKLLITEARLAIAQHERDIVLNSTFWRATAPLRRLINLVRPPRARADDPAAAHQGLGPTAYERWVARHDTLDDADRAAIHAHIEQLDAPPVIAVVMPVYNTPEPLLRAAIASVRAQLYPHWQLCIADDASPAAHVAAILAEAAAADPRIRWIRLPRNANISAATNAALALATAPFAALMDHDDLLPEHALYQIAVELDAHPDADLIYSDEDQIDEFGRRTLPYFKPAFNIDLMRAHNMISHLGVYRRALIEQLGGLRAGYEGSQDYDLALRVIDATTPDRIRHIPAVLYHWRQQSASFSKARLDTCVEAARRAVADHLVRTGEAATATLRPAPHIPTWTRIQYRLPDPAPLVTIIIPTRDKPDLLAACIDGLRRTDYPRLELIIADNGSEDPNTLALFAQLRSDPSLPARILPCAGRFNYSAMNNAAAAIANGELLALLNNDIEIAHPDWLTEMASQALRPGVGAVGARLLFPNNTVQHAGVVLGVGSFDNGPGVAGHFSLAESAHSFGYFGASVLVHEVSAVTAACMVLRKSVWHSVNGLDAESLAVAFNDVDFCLRLRARGLRILYTPYAELIHHESASRGDDLSPEHRARFHRECQTMRDRWAAQLDNDPFYNPNFSRQDGLFRLTGAPLHGRPWQ